jgi:hypothetical protein
MYNAGKIIAGLIIFLILVTFPVWFNLGKAATPPELQLPATEKECIEPKGFMRAKHMELVDLWRTEVVRNGKRIYVGASGRMYDMSLQNTCMSCHSSKSKFCDKCHNYVAVAPNCWNCHIEPKEGR